MPVTTYCKNFKSRIIRENVKMNSACDQVQSCLSNLQLSQLVVHALFSADFCSCNFIKLITALGVNFVKFGCLLLALWLFLLLTCCIFGIFPLGVDDPIVCEHPPQQHFEQQQQPNFMKFTPIVVNSFIKIQEQESNENNELGQSYDETKPIRPKPN